MVGEDGSSRASRRRVLAGASAVGVGSIAGCLRPLVEGESAETATGSADGEGNDGETANGPASLELPWELRAQAPTGTPPVLDGGTVYAGNVDGSLYAVEAATGDLRWTHDVGAEIRTVTLDGESAFVTTNDDLVVIDVTGPETRYTVEDRGNHNRPLVTDEVVYALREEHVAAVDRSDGTTRWSVEVDSPIGGRPARADDLLVTSDAGDVSSFPSDVSTLYGIDAETGDRQWETPVESDSLVSDVVTIGETALFSGRHEAVAGVDAATGDVRWTRSFEKEGNVPRPFVAAGGVFVGRTAGGTEPVVAGLDPETGETRWEVSEPLRELYVGEEALYGASWKDVVGIDPEAESVDFRQTIDELPDTGIEYRPVVTDDAVFLAEGARLYGFERSNEVDE